MFSAFGRNLNPPGDVPTRSAELLGSLVRVLRMKKKLEIHGKVREELLSVAKASIEDAAFTRGLKPPPPSVRSFSPCFERRPLAIHCPHPPVIARLDL
jgi:hypothetical protein